MLGMGFVYALIGVFLWSSAATVAGVITTSANFITITISLQLGGIFFFGSWFLKDQNYKKEIVYLMRLVSRKKVLNYILFHMLLFSFTITAYYLCFYYSIQNSPKIQANILNYLWPILTSIMSIYIFKNEKRKFGLYELSLLGLSFLGAMLVAWDITASNPFGTFHFGYIIALLAAVFAALYLNFIFKLKRFIKSTQVIYFSALTIALPFTILFTYIFNLSIDFSLDSVPWLLYLSIVVFGGGQYVLIKSMEIDNMVTITSLAYLTPLFSSVMLNVFLDEPYTNTIVLGGLLIIFSNILLSNSFSHFYAHNGALIGFISIGIITYIDPTFFRVTETDNNIGGYLSAIFSILTGFTLSRVWNKNQKEDEYLVDINEKLKKYEFSISEKTALYKFIQRITDLDFAKNSTNIKNSSIDLLKSFDSLKTITNKKIDFHEIEILLKKWMLLKVDKVSKAELNLLIILGGLVIFDFMQKIGKDFFTDLTAI
ncbi:DMT family transporter, partial [Sulfurimonas sp.]|nr:DMT family transporter [Sulfurimonas sp.]